MEGVSASFLLPLSRPLGCDLSCSRRVPRLALIHREDDRPRSLLLALLPSSDSSCRPTSSCPCQLSGREEGSNGVFANISGDERSASLILTFSLQGEVIAKSAFGE